MAVSTASFCISSLMSALFMTTRLPEDGGEDFRSSEEGFPANAPAGPFFESSLIVVCSGGFCAGATKFIY